MFELRLSQGLGLPLVNRGDFYPTDVLNMIGLWDARRIQSVELGATMLASGPGTPPAVSIEAVDGFAQVLPAVRVEITSSTQFRWTHLNQGTTGTFTGSAGASGVNIPSGGGTYVLPGTGLRVIFDLGFYASGQVYQATVQRWRSQRSPLDAFVQDAPAKQPRYLVDPSGRPFLDADGVDDTMFCSTIDRPAPNVTPTFYFGLARADVLSSFDTLICGGSAAANQIAINLSGSPGQVSATNGTGITISGATLSAFRQFAALFKASAAGHSGSDPAAWGDYLQWGGVASSVNTSMATTNPNAGLCLFSRNDVASTFWNGALPFIAVYSAMPSQPDHARLQTWAATAYWDADVVT